jgi:hypothetical protein
MARGRAFLVPFIARRHTYLPDDSLAWRWLSRNCPVAQCNDQLKEFLPSCPPRISYMSALPQCCARLPGCQRCTRGTSFDRTGAQPGSTKQFTQIDRNQIRRSRLSHADDASGSYRIVICTNVRWLQSPKLGIVWKGKLRRSSSGHQLSLAVSRSTVEMAL